MNEIFVYTFPFFRLQYIYQPVEINYSAQLGTIRLDFIHQLPFLGNMWRGAKFCECKWWQD